MELSAKDLMKKDFVRVDANSPVSEMLGALEKSKHSHAIVFNEDGDYLGISSKTAVLRKRIDPSKVKVGNAFEKKPLLEENASLQQVAEAMIGSDSKILPVQHAGKIVGVVLALDVVKQLPSAVKDLAELQAKEIASLKPVILPLDATFGKLVETMIQFHVSKIPIVGPKGELKGIVGFSELMQHYLHGLASQKTGATKQGKGAHDVGKKDNSLSDSPVSNLLVENVKTVSLNDNLQKIIKTMVEANVSDVIVLDKGKLAGIITLGDLLEVFVRFKKEKRNIQFVNLPELDEIDVQFLNNAITDCFDKTKKVLGRISYFVVHFKFHEHEGLRRQTTVHLRLSTPGKLFVATSTGWILLDALHDSIKILEREVFENSKK